MNKEYINRDLQELKYIELVIKEALRMFPSVPAIGRTIEEDTRIGNIFQKFWIIVDIFIYVYYINL